MQLNWRLHDGNGPHLLLVHGFLCSAVQWQSNLAALARDFRCVTVDLLGHGRSPAPNDDAVYTPDRYVAAFEALRAQLGVERWLTLGYSMGAGLTLRHALQHPEAVLGTAFTNTTSAFANADQIERMQGAAQKSIAQLRTEGAPALTRLAVHPQRATQLPTAVKQALVEDAQRLSPDGVARTLAVTIPQLSVREQFANLRPPALMLQGTAERRFRKHAEFAQQQLPGLKTVQLAAGHGVNMEQPVAFAEALRSFKQSLQN